MNKVSERAKWELFLLSDVIFIGLDVSKKGHIDAIILLDEAGVKSAISKDLPAALTMRPNRPWYELLIAWARQHSRVELSSLPDGDGSDRPYHEHLALALHQAGAVVSVVNPKRIKT